MKDNNKPILTSFEKRLPGPNSQSMSEKEFREFSEFIYNECGIKMSDAKKTMLEARFQKRLRVLGLKSYREYRDYVFSLKGMELELPHFIDVVTTNKTDFFREPKHFEILTQQVLPQWCAKYSPRKTFRIWSAGCSTGEEPYTMAMVLTDYAEKNPGFRFQIMASDISTRVLDHSLKAIYEEEKVIPVPPSFKKKYLLRSKDRSQRLVRIVPELRRSVTFMRLNFMEEFGLKDLMDVIFCRNVIIYFDRPTQEGLLNRFCRQIEPDGYIFIGHSETLTGMNIPLEQVAPTVYRKSKFTSQP